MDLCRMLRPLCNYTIAGSLYGLTLLFTAHVNQLRFDNLFPYTLCSLCVLVIVLEVMFFFVKLRILRTRLSQHRKCTGKVSLNVQQKHVRFRVRGIRTRFSFSHCSTLMRLQFALATGSPQPTCEKCRGDILGEQPSSCQTIDCIILLLTWQGCRLRIGRICSRFRICRTSRHNAMR